MYPSQTKSTFKESSQGCDFSRSMVICLLSLRPETDEKARLRTGFISEDENIFYQPDSSKEWFISKYKKRKSKLLG
ncbi:hypothetical protein TNCV_2480531 [Trichonephila clavipes]|nr:hypothetical protein TNCV_2480531 [Trichonephila clavipes]